MVEYKCGHKTNGVLIIDDNPLSIAGYLNWSESVGIFGTKEQCYECYCKENG